MAILLKADGTRAAITETLTLEAMQRLVGGYIEMVTIGGTREQREVLIVDEEGQLKEKPVNLEASHLYRGEPQRHTGIIVGDAIQCVVEYMGLKTERYL